MENSESWSSRTVPGKFNTLCFIGFCMCKSVKADSPAEVEPERATNYIGMKFLEDLGVLEFGRITRAVFE